MTKVDTNRVCAVWQGDHYLGTFAFTDQPDAVFARWIREAKWMAMEESGDLKIKGSRPFGDGAGENIIYEFPGQKFIDWSIESRAILRVADDLRFSPDRSDHWWFGYPPAFLPWD